MKRLPPDVEALIGPRKPAKPSGGSRIPPKGSKRFHGPSGPRESALRRDVEAELAASLRPTPPKANLPRAQAADPGLLAAKIALAEQQREKLEIANAKARGELLPAAEVEKEWGLILRDLRASLLSLSARIGQKLPHLSTHDLAAIDAEVREALTELADAG